MSQHALPVLFTLLLWWFSTSVILYLDGLPRWTFRWSLLSATLLLALALYCLAVTSTDTSVGGAYLAFTSGVLVWAWQEVSFLMGFVTGPRRSACPDGCSGWQHFGHAIQAILYHELALIAAAAAVVAVTWDGPNQTGTWTFLILWAMRTSAKLNLFLGVRNLSAELLPDHLRYLKGFFTKRPMNLLFPLSVTAATVVATALVQTAVHPATSEFQAAGLTFLATLMALAILEHWLLVLPLPTTALWRWGLRSRSAPPAFLEHRATPRCRHDDVAFVPRER